MKRNHNKLAIRLSLFAVALLSLLLVGTAFGQDGRLSVDMASSSPRIRSNAPVQLLLKTFWNGSSIVEGHFKMKYLTDGATVRSDCKSHDIVLTPGEQVIRLTLPTSGTGVSYGQDAIALEFVMPDDTIELGKYPLLASPSDRSMNVCVIGPTDDRKISDAEAEVTDSLRLNSLLIPKVSLRSVSTLFTRWDNVDVPEQASLLCTFDQVVVRPEGLSDLRKKQMDALLNWVRAGGSVCVMLSDDLKGTHVEFLNALIAEQHETPFALGTEGQFIPDDLSSDDGIWTSHLEIGRAAVVNLEEMPKDVDSLWKDCRKMAAFLWKIRKNFKSQVLAQSRANIEQKRQGSGDYPEQNRGSSRQALLPSYSSLGWQPIQTSTQLINRLMPKDVQVVPMFLIAMVLLAYLIMIGPVDYYVLGFFRRRRYTWITFPLTTIAVAMLCVGISDAYLSSKKGGRSLTVRDIGANGEVLRETRFQMRFLSRKAKVSTEVQNEIFTPLDQDRLNMNAQYIAYGNPSVNQKDIPIYEGRIPSNYVVEQEIPQWSPQINRFLAIAPEVTADGFAWDDKSLVTKSNRGKLRQLISKKWPNGTAMIFRGDQREYVVGSRIFKMQETYFDPRYGNIPVQYRGQITDQRSSMTSFMNSLCIRNPAGLFQFVSQISPTGGDNFEDLTIYDNTDRNQALLVVAFEEGDDLVLYRRLYTNLNK